MKLTSNDVHETMTGENHAMSVITDDPRRLPFTSNRTGVMAINRGDNATLLESDPSSKFNSLHNDIDPYYSQ
jgi:hypothetical protein